MDIYGIITQKLYLKTKKETMVGNKICHYTNDVFGSVGLRK